MNRAERRKISKGNKQLDGDLKYLNTPVTITEAVQIARGVAEDVISDYSKHTQPVQVAISLQIELLKKIIFEAGLITEEEFKEMYIAEAADFTKMQQEMLYEEEVSEEDGNPKVAVKANDIEVQKV